ncbi:MAG: tol-pal system YbgF family protein [Kofleriaceae bacterium]
MTRAWIVGATLASALAMFGAEARAQSAADPAAAALDEGRRLYDLREWDLAIAKFKEAYRLRPEPASLFNIAQSYRLKGDCIEAINFYRTYKRKFPKEKNIARVDQLIAELEPCPAAKPVPAKPEPVPPRPTPSRPPATPPATPPAPLTAQPIAVQPSQPTRHPGRTQRIIGISAAGVGAAGVIGSVVFALKARSIARDVEDGPAWDPKLDDRGKSAATNAKILGAVGGALVVGGTVLYILGRRTAAEQPPIAIVPTQDSASLVWSCAF